MDAMDERIAEVLEASNEHARQTRAGDRSEPKPAPGDVSVVVDGLRSRLDRNFGDTIYFHRLDHIVRECDSDMSTVRVGGVMNALCDGRIDDHGLSVSRSNPGCIHTSWTVTNR